MSLLQCDSVETYVLFARCRCPAGYRGLTCSKLITHCRQAPCRNGGVCHDVFVFGKDTVTGYRCVCPRRFRGRNCEKHKQLMTYSCHRRHAKCQYGGTCYVHRSVARCICTPMYMGRQCEINIHLHGRRSCDRSPCLNGGRCQVRLPYIHIVHLPRCISFSSPFFFLFFLTVYLRTKT